MLPQYRTDLLQLHKGLLQYFKEYLSQYGLQKLQTREVFSSTVSGIRLNMRQTKHTLRCASNKCMPTCVPPYLDTTEDRTTEYGSKLTALSKIQRPCSQASNPTCMGSIQHARRWVKAQQQDSSRKLLKWIGPQQRGIRLRWVGDGPAPWTPAPVARSRRPQGGCMRWGSSLSTQKPP